MLGIIALPGQSIPAPERCLGRRATIVGSPRRDVLSGTRAADVIFAGKGADLLHGLNGRDVLCGGVGRDRIRGGPGPDRLSGGSGGDTVDGNGDDDALEGGPGADLCFQGPGEGRSRSCAPVVAAAGDIACDPAEPSFNGGQGTATACRMRATSDLLLRTNLAGVLTLGDNQYSDGAAAKFAISYGPTWGRALDLTHPTPGNHDYGTPAAQGYFEYFGAAAGDPALGAYSFDLGTWHFVALNSNCAEVGGCGPGSPQARWLTADLLADGARCSLAYWHHPRFSSAGRPATAETAGFWAALHEAGTELVLNGHEHVYERFAPQQPDGTRDPAGMRQIIVGTGGRDLTGFTDPVPNSLVRSNTSFGVLEVALARGRYAWRFVPIDGDGFTDSGSGRCH
jgi:Ca2+-binding RTX toxin-like protein